MARAIDVAEAILVRAGTMSTFRLQKLLYYAQAVHLVEHDVPLYRESIEGWANGPTVRAVYRATSGQYSTATVGGSADALTETEVGAVDKMLALYGHATPGWLVQQTHIEQPWLASRAGLAEEARGDRVIPNEAIREYYAKAFADQEAERAMVLAADPGAGLTRAEMMERYRDLLV